ncbi:ribonuclease E/G [Paracoccus sp. TK19116]|uniref:Ribonuclease E n=1 Tax=Paracoccus albicereus TaxID=2922394 RepID=A0ABT1MQD1_9RHOB|nr:ribonuclease E/G [Paracoccus albicereus]MCQ0970520.1 ribonuclease E/G [Paracoccus albicereus]
MAKKMLIDATHAEETRVVVVDGTKVEEFDFETVNKRQLAGNIYLAKITRVEPSLQAAFVDYGGNRHGFLAFAEIHPDYYQIPAADREALLAEERAYAEAQEAEEQSRGKRRGAKAQAADDEAEKVEGDVVEGDEAVDAAEKDESIESVAEEDVAEEIRPAKKPRARRYKIQEVVKVRQIMLVQVVKEERGNKGAALTTYLSLAGRYCVLMPNTARGGGISRKITNAADRKKLKDIAGELEVPKGAGLIIRTAGSQRTRTEIKRDYEYLMRLWEQIRELTFQSVAPAPVYEEGDLIKRTIRDIYSKEIDEVLVEGEGGYRTAKDFMKMIMPSHAKNVKHYNDPMPLYARYQVESYLGGMFNPTVQLKSGGYIVIGVTEALVAIDVNSGRATKEGSIEETATKTNLEAAEEIARQLRLRDLAGLIVIDFIDMDERKNNAAVEKRLKDKLKTDRARIQVGKISGFGLMEMSRQRLRPGMLESTTQPCAHCHGTGLIRSDDSLALTILRAIEEEGTKKRTREVLVKAPVAVANFLMNAKREHIAGIEARYGMSVRVEADPALISPDFALEKFKTATRAVPEAGAHVVSADADLMAQIDDESVEDDEADTAEDDASDDASARTSGPGDRSEDDDRSGDEGGKSRRRRRRRRRKSGDRSDEDQSTDDANTSEEGSSEEAVSDADTADQDAAGQDDDTSRDKPRRSRGRGRGRRKKDDSAGVPEESGDPASESAAAKPEGEVADAAATAEPNAAEAEVEPEKATPETVDLRDPAPAPAEQADDVETELNDGAGEELANADSQPAAEPEPALADADQASGEPLSEKPARPKRRGWWSLGR